MIFDVVSRQYFLHHTIHIQQRRVVRRIGLVGLRLHLPLHEILVLVQISDVRRHTEVMPHVLRPQPLLPRHQRLVELLAVARPDDVRARVAEQLLHALRQISDGRCVRLLDEQVAWIRMFEREPHELYGLVEVHEEARHGGVRDRDGISGLDLVDEQRNNRSTTAHDIAIPRAADDRPAALRRHAGVCRDDMLHQRFGNAHRVDGVRRLVRRKADDTFHARIHRGVEDVIRSLDVCLDSLHREELAARHLLQYRRMEDVI